jgi:PAS domain S-box-containing protein
LPLRLLLIEDSEDDALLLVRELRKGGFDPDFLRVDTPQALENALEGNTWDAVVADYNMPAFTGLDALRTIQAKGLDLPFILVSGVIGEEQAVEAMKAGAHDYIMKGNFPRLVPALKRELQDAEVRREQRQAEEELAEYRENLEEIVRERTVELERANEVLRAEIAERERAEEALRESRQHNEFLANIIELSSQSFAVGYPDGRLGLFNHAYEQLTGYAGDELRSIDWAMVLTPPEWREIEREKLEEMLRTGQPVRYEKEYLRKDGSRVPVELLVHLVTDAAGKPEYFYAFITDITGHKLAEEKLLKAKEDAEAANRAKSEFLSNMTHEMRTPLTGVMGVVDYLLMLELPDEQRYLLEMANTSGNTLKRLINDVLDFSRMVAGKMSFKMLPFNTRDCFRSAVDILRMEAERKGLRFSLEIADGVPETIEGDEGRVRQLLLNLVGNAVKFTEEGEIAVSLRPAPVRDFLLCTIRDTGIGIPADCLEKIFDRFTQVDMSVTKSFGGCGIGLALSKQIIDAMGGDIRVESRLGEGSIFSFTFDTNVRRANSQER